MIVSVAELMPSSYPAPGGPLLLGEPGFERVEDLDRRGVDPLEHREVQRHEVAEQDQRHDTLDRRPAARAHANDLRGLRRDELARQLDARADARMLVGVLEEHAGEPAELRRALPPDDLVVVELGE